MPNDYLWIVLILIAFTTGAFWLGVALGKRRGYDSGHRHGSDAGYADGYTAAYREITRNQNFIQNRSENKEQA